MDPYVSKHTHTRWVHARSTELILQFARALLRAHRIFTVSLCGCPVAHLHSRYYTDDWGYDGEDTTYDDYDWEA